jgi:hypothetical protein
MSSSEAGVLAVTRGFRKPTRLNVQVPSALSPVARVPEGRSIRSLA